MACYIELQGYCTKEHGFVPKEVFLIADGLNKSYYIKAIKPYKTFTQQDRKTIDWATKCYHFIPWGAGNIELADFLVDINTIASEFNVILTKGPEKSAYLSTILNRAVVDLGFYGCPSIRKIEKSACTAHFNKDAHCAIASGKFIFGWLNGNRNVAKLLGAIKEEGA
jgi:hypothetical protein